jgi:uncharacterized membrane protein
VRLRLNGLIGAAIALLGLAAAGYLTSVKLAGELPACGPIRGCETVALSTYSDIAGVPVAALGVVYSLVVLALNLVWWRAGVRAALLAAYGLGLLGVLLVAYLTWLELFVIHAVCVWCVAYGLTVIAGWLLAAIALRRQGA